MRSDANYCELLRSHANYCELMRIDADLCERELVFSGFFDMSQDTVMNFMDDLIAP